MIATGRALVAVPSTAAEAVGAVLQVGDVVPLPAATGQSLGSQLLETRPDFVVLGQRWEGRGGREVLMAMRDAVTRSNARVVAIVDAPSLGEVIAWFHAGAAAVWCSDDTHRCRFQDVAPLGAPVHERLLKYAATYELTGTAVFFPSTPFEATARFEAGGLAEATLGPKRGLEALADAVSVEDTPVRFETRDTVRHFVAASATQRHRARLLVVEDEPALRELVSRQLAALGSVKTAINGPRGLELAEAEGFDVIVLDLALPGLDGWGVLRHLKEHPLARESMVLVSSAYDDTRNTLEAARAGANAYLTKSGKAKDLVPVVEQLLGPRRAAWESLAYGAEQTSFELSSVGPLWLLRTLAELDVCGLLEASDSMGRYEVLVSHGRLAGAVAQHGSLRMQGPMAVEAFAASKGAAHFKPADVQAEEAAPWLHELTDTVAQALARDVRGELFEQVIRVSQLKLVDELAALYASMASTRELKVLSALRSEPVSIEALAKSAELTVEETEPIVAELLRRGVLA